MSSKIFSSLSAGKKVWLGLDYACDANRLRSALIKIIGLALFTLTCSIIGTLSLIESGSEGKHQVKVGSTEEKKLEAYVSMMGFKPTDSYELYAELSQREKIDSVWLPSKVVNNWLHAGLPSAVQAEAGKNKAKNNSDPNKVSDYEQIAGEWAQYKRSIKTAAGPIQRCSVMGSIKAGLPWEQSANQPRACQAEGYNTAAFKMFMGLLFISCPFLSIILFRVITQMSVPGWNFTQMILYYPRNQKLAFNAWFLSEGDKSLSRLERHQLALSARSYKSKRQLKLKKRVTTRL